MAEGILSNVAAKILESLGKHAYQEVVSCWGAPGDLEKLKETLVFIKARIHDAETRHEEENNEVIKEAIKQWLGRLRQVLYQADDLADEINTLSCRQQRADRSKLDKLQDLPRGFTKLTNLRHLGLRDCPLTEMPRNFGRMKSLQEMNRFIIGKNNGLDALADLNLRGELVIIFRRRRTNDVFEAKRANLKEKTQLTSFSLRFEYQGEETTVATRDDEQLLESLQLPTNLKRLYFSGLRGNRFPRWMLKELLKIVKISIDQCDSCRVLPLFSQLPLLKHLSLKYLLDVEYIEEADGVSSTSTYFPALESLKLINMPKLKSLVKLEDEDKLQARHNYVFPRLKKLDISHCDKLTTLPSLPNLESLRVEDIQGQLLESILTSNNTAYLSSRLPLLNYWRIEIKNCDICRVLPFLSRLPLLKVLTLRELEGLECVEEADEDSGSSTFFPLLRSLNPWEGFKSLLSLTLNGMPKVELLPDWITCLTKLQNLDIDGLDNLTELPQNIGNVSSLQILVIRFCPKLTSLPQNIGNLSSLQELVIWNCPKLTSLPQNIGNLSSLQVLVIGYCPKLTSLPQSFSALTCLQSLEIVKCSKLKKPSERPDGEYWLNTFPALR